MLPKQSSSEGMFWPWSITLRCTIVLDPDAVILMHRRKRCLVGSKGGVPRPSTGSVYGCADGDVCGSLGGVPGSGKWLGAFSAFQPALLPHQLTDILRTLQLIPRATIEEEGVY